MNNKGIGSMVAVYSVLGVVLAFFLIVQIHFDVSTSLFSFHFDPFIRIRATVNYGLIVALWIIIQVLFIYAYVKVALSLKKGYLLLKKYVFSASMKIENFILSHS